MVRHAVSDFAIGVTQHIFGHRNAAARHRPCARTHDRCHFLQQRVSTTGMNYIISNTWNSEIAYDTYDHKYQVCRISSGKESVAVRSYLVQVFFSHILYDRTWYSGSVGIWYCRI